MQPDSSAGRPLDVNLDHVTKKFGDVVAVDDLMLSIPSGEFFSLLGPSGCGKTTTLRMVGGFEMPTSGSIYLGGSNVTTAPPYRRDVNTVFQSYALFPTLNVYGNVAFGLRRRKLPKHEIDRRVRASLEMVDMTGLDRRKPSQLSGGQRQRVALARALVNRPKVLLLDEPLGALDARLRKNMQLELKRIQQDVGITFIYVTHDQDEALTMSDRLAVMRSGRIEQIGAPEDVYDRPATSFVANFLGESNLLRGRVQSPNRVVLASGESVIVPHALTVSDERVSIGVRPEKIALSPGTEPPPEGMNCLAGGLEMVAFGGSSYQYSVRLDETSLVTVYSQHQGRRASWETGARVHLLWHPDDTFVVAGDAGVGTD